MDIYFDESGNTGSVKNKNNRLNYDNQRHFALCGVICENEPDKEKLKGKYIKLKEKFNIPGEIKGNSLLTRDNNELLDYFINEVLDNTHFKINIYDKNFYLITKMLGVLTGFEFKEKYPLSFYQLASSLITENDDILIRYCQLEENLTIDNLKDFLNFLCDYSYCNPGNLLLSQVAHKIREIELEEDVLEDLIGASRYFGTSSKNIVNLSAIGEFLFMLKYESSSKLTKESLIIKHDKIDGFSKVFQEELAVIGVQLDFVDSTDNIFIQIADNAASIFCKIINQMVSIFEKKKEWDNENEWVLELASRLYNKIGKENIKFTLPIQNWAVALCVKEMFAPSFLKIGRNNLHFNHLYACSLFRINQFINKNMGMDASVSSN
jgi:hypothetical protein